MAEQIVIRSATSKDLQTLLRFEQGVITAERPFDETLKPGAIRYYDLEGMIGASHIMLAVAELNDKIVGSGYARIESSKPYLRHETHAYLGFMYVEPEQRGKGINKNIIQFLKEWAKQQGISELRLDVYIENAAAVRAYEKVGFSKHLLEMRMGI